MTTSIFAVRMSKGRFRTFSGEIALFDVLHYLPLAEQTALLSRLAKCVAPGGSLVIRDCPRDNSARFWMTYVAEKFAQAVSWNLNTSLHFPSRELITEAFNENEFERESRPLWGTSPFNNHLFVFRETIILARACVRSKTQVCARNPQISKTKFKFQLCLGRCAQNPKSRQAPNPKQTHAPITQ